MDIRIRGRIIAKHIEKLTRHCMDIFYENHLRIK